MLFVLLSVIDDHSYDDKFTEIYYEYEKLAMKLANKLTKDFHDAEDAVMEAFFGIARNISVIDTSDKSRLKVYICTTVRNACLDILKAKNKDIVYTDRPHLFSNEEYSIEEVLVENERLEALVKEVDALPVIYRDALTYKYIIELSTKEISNLLKIPESTVRSRIRNGLLLLKKRFKEAKV